MSKGKETATASAGHDNLPWVEKYRPSSLDDISGQESIVATVKKFLAADRLPHMLFYGPPGTGKTSTILAIAREIYGRAYKGSVLELNASDDRGIDVVREQIKLFASTKQMFSKNKMKLIILDEADAMTQAAQNALRRIMEKYTSNTRFCILANYSHKLTPAILSRCTRFRFSPLSDEAVRSQVQKVVQSESLSVDDGAIDALVDLSKGDMRRALNVLQACAASKEEFEPITTNMVYACVGAPRPQDLEGILEHIMSKEWVEAYDEVMKAKALHGLALQDLLTGLANIIEGLELTPAARIAMLDEMAQIEYRLSGGGNEKIQTSAVIGAIKKGLELQT
ncbi:hypothetical protein CANCADRAFT_97161 [Tortispora caseinolytica NRRL Y-17796]|uniref:AAA+ ATPase domain-containing protein n=1 Tax=Tortispora caseinolytica NRRL Y-17796 TaxID=767744 RepID=A0A1E4TDN9_9ASCO|nr:hypothetical protein CANCADRAFT_97161 [Tortispora caseinolytica NRRL Y-17796]